MTTVRDERMKLTKAQLADLLHEMEQELTKANTRADVKTSATLDAAALDKCVEALKTLTVRERQAYGGGTFEMVPDRATITRVLRYLAERFSVDLVSKS